MDGVLTRTAVVHAHAWKRMFDDFLSSRAQRSGTPFQPFEDADYQQYVDGRIRADGTRAFLASRGITIPEGEPDDPPSAETVHGLGNRKNAMVLEYIAAHGVGTYTDAVWLLREAHADGLRCAVVSASANTAQVLEVTGLADVIDARIDGVVAQQQALRGKPAPDTFCAGAAALGIEPSNAAVFEDAVSGVAAGHAGGFGLVVGVDRVGGGHGDELRRAGADVVVSDLCRLSEALPP
ncbi:MAG: beta-phosphoglucomutase [Acidimicrobiales bacterium]|nr:beta-phosphoglucomutase [Acidimicrobiales bacterium]